MPSAEFDRYLVNPGPKAPATGLKAAVTTDSAIVTETMVKVLRNGGSAADAGIAGCLVQAAVEPFMTNHAGLVTFLYYEAKTGRIHQLDSLGAHPSGLPPFQPVPPGLGPYSMMPPSAVIPGFMPGLQAIHQRFGTRPWAELCEDAVRWAETGHPVSNFEYLVNIETGKFFNYFPEGRDFWINADGFAPRPGQVFKPRGLAETLRGVAEQGPGYMIDGPWGQAFVAKANEMGWKIRPEHMSEVPPRWVEPIRFRHHEYEIVSLGPPQAQGIYCAIAMGVLRHLGLRGMEPGSADHWWAMGHALRQAQRHWEYAQDDGVYGVPREELLDDGYHAHLAKMIRAARPKRDLSEHIRLAGHLGADPAVMFGGGLKPRMGRVENENRQPSGSCELTVVDQDGNWVQMMNTLQGSGIPGMVIGGVPMVGSHATFGHLQSPMDSTLVPGAKARCIIGNTMVLKDGRPVASLGSPGNVHCTVPQVLAWLLDFFDLDGDAAISAPRMLPMTESRTLTIEDRLRAGTVEDLHRLGQRVNVTAAYDYHMGSFSVVTRDEQSGLYTAYADPRRCAVADGLR
ncbi:gamma-glutamyltransferase [Pelomonas sp. KK5]|uniref:gamma-glutamyltransferase n=1 Tax=Pelomonas sp. KK5 TaxID=1855730 RepID=UPI00097C8EA9|nr:gamma-glutamyltransferase [Pelomonas sp. KK5]